VRTLLLYNVVFAIATLALGFKERPLITLYEYVASRASSVFYAYQPHLVPSTAAIIC
jgi:hypothetical protein